MDLLGAVHFGYQQVRQMKSAGLGRTRAARASAFPDGSSSAASLFIGCGFSPGSGPGLDRQSRCPSACSLSKKSGASF
jgi:hypothetical protein